jgi:uncharacterized protein YbjT (DUF2867 family)
MTMINKTLVFGANGTVGSLVVSALVEAGVGVRGISSRKHDERSLATKVEWIQAYIQHDDLAPLFNGIDSVFLMVPLHPDMQALGLKLNAAAAAAQCPRIVRLSATSAMHDPRSQAGMMHSQIDSDLLAKRPDAFILRPHGFMQNLLGMAPMIAQGVLPQPLAVDSVDALIDARDIAASAVAGLFDHSLHGAADISGPELVSPALTAELLSNALGRTVVPIDVPNDEARSGMRKIGLTEWLIDRILEQRELQESGPKANVSASVQQITKRPAVSLAQFIVDHRSAFIA